MSKRRDLSEGKKNIIASLVREYGIQSAEDIQDALKDLLGGTLEEMLRSEMREHLGYGEYERSENDNARNGVKTKKIRSKYGELGIAVPQDRNGSGVSPARPDGYPMVARVRYSPCLRSKVRKGPHKVLAARSGPVSLRAGCFRGF